MEKPPELPRVVSDIRRNPTLPPELEEVSKTLARIENPNRWFCCDQDELRRLTSAAVLSNNGETGTRLQVITVPIYLAYCESVSVEERREFIDEVWRHVVRGETNMWALWDIACLEDNPALVSAATHAFACVRLDLEDTPEATAEELGDVVEAVTDETLVGVFHGMMILGIEEFLNYLRPARQELTDDEVFMVCEIPLKDPTTGTILFLLEWLEEAQLARDHGKFKAIANALTPGGSQEESDPYAENESEVATNPDILIAGTQNSPIAPSDFARQIEPRLRAIAERETGPRLMPSVIEAWGLGTEVEGS